ncbi:hypothetical protein [Ideonella sp. YS5]|uniref:hypothetical protein n=1 Tax=Ideonella sp. YS5 TaxID=3453714 RepID=UPI003EEEB31A
MADSVAPEFERFIDAERRAKRVAALPGRMVEGQVFEPVFVEQGQASELMRVAARRAVGFYRPTQRTEVVWVDGDRELAVGFAGVEIKMTDGLLGVFIPVRCDQTGPVVMQVAFAVGSAGKPGGVFAAAHRRPYGPELIVTVWGDALVAFAWQCVLGLVSQIAGATGKDARGNVLVPVEFMADAKGLQIVPMARYRFSGSSGLKT